MSDLERTIQSNWQLCNAIAEYQKARQDVLTFTRAYIESGGDKTTPPGRWDELDSIREAKYAAMLAAAGLAQ